MIRQKPSTWFHANFSPLNTRVLIIMNTNMDTPSWTVFSSNMSKGPPSPLKPIRLAGIMNKYSKKANGPADQHNANKAKIVKPGYFFKL